MNSEFTGLFTSPVFDYLPLGCLIIGIALLIKAALEENVMVANVGVVVSFMMIALYIILPFLKKLVLATELTKEDFVRANMEVVIFIFSFIFIAILAFKIGKHFREKRRSK